MLKQFAKIEVSGRIANDPILEFTGGGKAKLKMGVFVNQGEFSEYIPVIAWENTAKYIADKPLEKGDAISFTGRIDSKFFDAEDGKRLNTTFIIMDVIAYEKKKGDEVAKSE